MNSRAAEPRKIIHVDMDAFYASVEQRDKPEYRGKPVVVGGSPQGRGVVAAASYEARKFGIHSAMPASRAVQLCPNAVFLKPRFDVYKEVSGQIREIFFEYTDLVEPLSLDEAYLDVTVNRKNNPSATLIAREIKKRIRNATELTASAGVAGNKFLAKIASDLDKPNGLSIITPDEAEAFIEQLPIGDFYGVGKATQQKMEKLGIRTGKDLKKWSEVDLVKQFGKSGHHYYRIARGIDNRTVKPDRIRKSIGKERTFSEDVSDLEWIHEFLDELSGKISQSMKKLDASGKTITLKVRYRNFETVTRSATLHHYTHSAEELAATAKTLLAETEAGIREVRLLGISVSSLNLTEGGSFGEQLELPFRLAAGKTTK
ncbi:DNA polymerase IV [Rhodohalobacter mucosus]|uniref:DNA polymerase IV n=1 Tax=Rhodohalobacter mucosus TaxID=2079485 RepID=A0A316TMM0_9BACT|nr:DNA polymerase IV [Rhodohalobacter mucosus]PWN05847.1 DNA polymerase IV [Rhodohalobacter mucosus]